MSQITLTFTVEELKLLVSLASDHLFRREFIDPRFPGHKADPGAVTSGKALVGRLRLMMDPRPRETRPAPPATSTPAGCGPVRRRVGLAVSAPSV